LALRFIAAAQLPIELKHINYPPSALLAPGAKQGTSAAVDGRFAVVGAPDDTIGGTGSGVVKVYDTGTGQLLYLIPCPEPGFNRAFGFAVDVSGSLVAVGAYGTTINGMSSVGRAYVFDLTSGSPTKPIATLDKPNPKENSLFGTQIAISGTKVVVGDPDDSTGASRAGRAYVFDLASQMPEQTMLTLTKPNPLADDSFGSAVAIDGSIIAVAAAGDDTKANNAGAVYVFDLNNSSPAAPVAKLLGSASDSGVGYGRGVSIHGARIAVGSSGKLVGGIQGGGVDVYDLASPSPTVPIWAANNPTPAAGEFFGKVALEGNRLIVTASGDDTGGTDVGVAYLYDLALPGSQSPRIMPNPTPAGGDFFGVSAGLSGKWAIVGAYQDDTAAMDAGSAYLYDLESANPTTPVQVLKHTGPMFSTKFGRTVASAGRWLAVAGYQEEGSTYRPGIVHVYDQASSTPDVPFLSLQHTAPEFEDGYGSALAISGSILIVGSPLHGPNQGTVHVYNLAGANPATAVLILQNPTPNNNDYFGCAVAIEGMRLVVGSYLNGNATRGYGSAYVYDLSSATPSVPKLTLDNPIQTSGYGFGSSVALSGNRLLVGVPADNTGATAAGRAYVYDLAGASPTVPALTLDNPDPNPDANFGGVVRLIGNRAVISATGNDTGAPRAGAVYVYDLAQAAPSQPVTTLLNPFPRDSDYFGLTALSGSILAVACNSYLSFQRYDGVIRLYDLDGKTPSQPIKTLPRPALVGSGFYVSSMSLEAGRLFAGLPFNNDLALERGAVLLYGPDSIPPKKGSFVVVPSTTARPSTALTATFQGWDDDSLPLNYAVMMGSAAVVPAGPSSAPTFSLPAGTHTVYGRVADSSGNTRDSDAVTITIDGAAPLITVPSDLIVEAQGPSGTRVTFSISATDDLDANPVVTSSRVSGALFAIGQTQVDVAASDEAGNLSSTTFSVTVQDTTPPVIGGTFAPLKVVAGTLPDYTAQALSSDAVGVVSITQVPPPGSVTAPGKLDVTLTAQDAAQNSSSVTFRVLVKPEHPVKSIVATTREPVHASAGLPAGAIWSRFGTPAVNEAGDIAFHGRWNRGRDHGEGVWISRDDSEYLECVVTRGAIIGGDAGESSTFRVAAILDPVIADNGDVAVPVGVAAEGSRSAPWRGFVWSPAADRASSRVILCAGQEVPGTGGGRLAVVQGIALDTAGVAFYGKLRRGTGNPAVTAANESVCGVWTSDNGTRVLARTGQPLAGSVLKTMKLPLISRSAPDQSRGWASLEPGLPARVGLVGGLADGSQVLFSIVEGDGAAVIMKTAAATSAGADLTDPFSHLHVPAWSDRVSAAVLAAESDSGTQNIVRASSEGISIVHSADDEIEPGIFLRSIEDPIASPDGTFFAWQATLRGKRVDSDNNSAIILSPHGSVPGIFAREGSPAADAPRGALYGRFQSIALTAQGLLIRGSLRVRNEVTGANDDCLWAQGMGGQPRLILREGETIAGRKLQLFSVLTPTSFTWGTGRSFSDSGFLVALARLTSGHSAIVKVLLP
jgi:hypothetical protein